MTCDIMPCDLAETIADSNNNVDDVAFTEKVAVRSTDKELTKSCSSYLDVRSIERFRSSIHLKHRLKPVNFSDKLVCYTESSKKRFRTTVHYQPRYNTSQYTETNYVMPRRAETTVVSALNYGQGNSGKWFATSVRIPPKVYRHKMVYNFHMHRSCDDDTESEDGSYSGSYSSSIYVQDPETQNCYRMREKALMMRRSSADNLLSNEMYIMNGIMDTGYENGHFSGEEETVIL